MNSSQIKNVYDKPHHNRRAHLPRVSRSLLQSVQIVRCHESDSLLEACEFVDRPEYAGFARVQIIQGCIGRRVG